MHNQKTGGLEWAILLVLAFIWGSSFVLIKYALQYNGKPTLDPIEVGALRMALAALGLLPITLRHARWFKSHWKPLLVVGLFGNGLPAFLFAIAQTRIDSALAGMLNSSTPLFTLVVGVLFFGVKGNKNNTAGVLLGLVAAIFLIGSGARGSMPNDPSYALLALVGSFCYSVSVNTIKSRLHEIPSLAIAGLALTFAGLPCLIYLLLTGFPSRLSESPEMLNSFASVTVLALLGTAIALVLFNKLVERTSAVFSSSVTYMLPVVAIGWGLWDGETITTMQYLCIALILASIMLVSRKASSA